MGAHGETWSRVFGFSAEFFRNYWEPTIVDKNILLIAIAMKRNEVSVLGKIIVRAP